MTEDAQLYQALGRLEGKVDALLSAMARQDKRLDDFDARITKLEAAKHQGTGALRAAHFMWLGIAALAGAFADQLKGLLFK